MTDQNKMPKSIGLFRCESEGDIKWSDDLTNSLAVYTRTDIHQAALAEIAELRGLVEGMGKYLSGMVEAADDCRIDSQHLCNPHTGQETHKWHEEWAHEAKKQLTAYQAYKEKMDV